MRAFFGFRVYFVQVLRWYEMLVSQEVKTGKHTDCSVSLLYYHFCIQVSEKKVAVILRVMLGLFDLAHPVDKQFHAFSTCFLFQFGRNGNTKTLAEAKAQSTMEASRQIHAQSLWWCLRAVWTLPWQQVPFACVAPARPVWIGNKGHPPLQITCERCETKRTRPFFDSVVFAILWHISEAEENRGKPKMQSSVFSGENNSMLMNFGKKLITL